MTEGDTGSRRGSELPGSHRKGRGVDTEAVATVHWAILRVGPAPVGQPISVGPDRNPPAEALPGEGSLGVQHLCE